MIILPSLEIVPAKYNTSTNTLLSQIPIDGTGDFTVSRTTSPVTGQSTRVNALGQIELVADNVPRLDYPIGGGCPALLVEPAATNLAPNANLMNILDTPTVSGGVTFTTGSTDFLAPDGTSATINKYVGGAASGATQSSRYSTTAITATASGVHTFSLFVKRGATNPIDFCAITPVSFAGISPSPGRSFFNLASGTAITSGARIENYGNGWYRLISQPLTLAAGDLIGGMAFELASTSGSVSFAASGALNLTAYTWGAQFEAGSVATSYIPTTTGSVTRNADVISVSGAVSGSIGQASGTIYIECQSEFATNDIIVINTAGQSPGNNYVSITKTATNVFRLTLVASGTIILIDQTSAITSFAKIAVAYASGNTALFINGTQIGSTNTTGFSFNAALNNITFISNMVSGTKPTRIRAAALYTTRLTDTQLALLTSPYTSYSSMASALSYTLG